MEENKIMQMIVVGVKSLLVIEPINSIRSDTCLTWNLKLSAVVGRSIKCVDTQNFSTSVRRHNWNTRSEVSQIFLLICFASRSWIVHIPHITSPTQIHTVGVVDFMEIILREAFNLVASSPDPWDASCLDEFKGTGEVVREILCMLRINYITRKHDKIRTLLSQRLLNQSLGLQIIL